MESLTANQLALYLGCECEITLLSVTHKDTITLRHLDNLGAMSMKPILRPLSDMTEEEAEMIYMLATNEMDFRANDVWLVHDYMMEGDKNDYLVSKGIRNSKRDWWEVNIDIDFNVLRYEDDDKPIMSQRHSNQHRITAYLLSKHFDIFKWIEKGLAIDKSTLTK